MKKLIPALFISGVISSVFVSCGPSAEEKAAAEQRMKDSIAAIEMATADSLMAVQQKITEDSLAMVQAAQDSMRIADSIAAATKGPKTTTKPKPKPAPEPTKPTDVKPGQGRD